MSDILGVYTSEQHYEFLRNYLIAKGCPITDFNDGAALASLLKGISVDISATSADMYLALKKAIPTSLVDGLGMTKKVASKAIGYFRYYRVPIFTIKYLGTDESCTLTISGTELSTSTSGTPADDLSLLFSSYPSVDDILIEINNHASYSANLVGNGALPNVDLYQYTAVDVKGSSDYLAELDSKDILMATAEYIPISQGAMTLLNNVGYTTTQNGSIAAGDASSGQISAICTEAGPQGNLVINYMDTINGLGTMTSSIVGVQHVINDSAFYNGRDSETDEERSERVASKIKSLTGTGCTEGIRSAVLEIPNIRAVNIRENYPVNGRLTVIADNGSGYISSDEMDMIQLVLNGDPDNLVEYPGVRGAGITANIDTPIPNYINYLLTVTRVGETSDEEELRLSVKSAVEQYTNSLQMGHDVILSEAGRVGKNAHIAAYDVVITTPGSNVPIDESSIARTGAGTPASVIVNIITVPKQP